MKPEDRERLIAYRKAERAEREADELAWYDDKAKREAKEKAERERTPLAIIIARWALFAPFIIFFYLIRAILRAKKRRSPPSK